MLNYLVWGDSGLYKGSAYHSHIDVSDSHFVALNLEYRDVQAVARNGNDLEIHLNNGEVITLQGFFADFQQSKSVMISANGEIAELNVQNVVEVPSQPYFVSVPDGELTSYMMFNEPPALIEDSFWKFDKSAFSDPAYTDPNVEVLVMGANEAEPATGFFGGAWLLGGAAVAASAAFLMQSSDDDGSASAASAESAESAATTSETSAEQTPTPTITQLSGTSICGTSVAGATISIDHNGDGSADVTTVADEFGNWSVGFLPNLSNGQDVTVFATMAGQTQSVSVTGQVDAITPAQPEIEILNATTLSGTGEVGSTIEVDINGDGTVDYSTTVATNGTWSISFNSAQADQTSVSVTAVDANKNTSSAVTASVDAAAPSTPFVAAAGTTALSGTAEAGATITIDVNGDGSIDYTTTADAQGDWSVTLNPSLSDGDLVWVTATDANLNVSNTLQIAIDGTAPASPIISVLNADRAMGTVDPNSTVSLDIDGDGNYDYTTTADANGNWQILFTAPIADGVSIIAIATDVNGNTSSTQTGIVDATVPLVPTVSVAGVGLLSGSAEAGSTVSIDANGDGIIDYTTVADANGDWSITLSPALSDGDQVVITTTDSNLNTSSATTVTIDGTAPTAPSVLAINSSSISGIAEPDATVSVDVDGDGVVDYTTTAAAQGNWQISFSAPLADGTSVSVTATDGNGNISVVQTASVDAVPPTAPSVGVVGPTEISGTTEPGATIAIDVNGDGSADYSVIADASGNWTVALNPALANGTQVSVTSTDTNNNQSSTTTATIDGVAPSAPVVASINATSASGTSEPNSTISLDVNADGIADYTTTTDANGDWNINLTSALANGTSVTATSTDINGNTSAPQLATVDADPPESPTITVAGASDLRGTAEAGSTVSVDVNGDGTIDYTTVVGASGDWAVNLNPTLTDGTQVSVTTTDTNQNVSSATVAIIDGLAPATPIISALSADTAVGTAEAGATIELDVDGDGAVDYSTTADANGAWQVNFSTGLAHGASVTATATDANLNTSSTQTAVVDDLPPDVPKVALGTDEGNLTGLAEPGSTLNISYVSSTLNLIDLNPVAVASDGSWSTVPNPVLDPGTDVFVSATDTNGNTSGEVLVLLGTGESLDFSSLPADIMIGVATHDIEGVDLGLNAANSMEITEATLIALSQTTDSLRIDGIAGNQATVTGATLNTTGAATIDSDVYDLYDFGSTQLLIDQDITVIT